MGSLDLTIFLVLGSVALIALTASVLCFVRAFKVSSEKDGDIKMFLWAAGGMLGLIIAGMSAAYFLLPLLFFHS